MSLFDSCRIIAGKDVARRRALSVLNTLSNVVVQSMVQTEILYF